MNLIGIILLATRAISPALCYARRDIWLLRRLMILSLFVDRMTHVCFTHEIKVVSCYHVTNKLREFENNNVYKTFIRNLSDFT